VKRRYYRHPADKPGNGAVQIGTEEMRLDDIYFVAADDPDQVPEVAEVETASGIDEYGFYPVFAQGIADPPRAPDGGNGLKMFVVHTSD